MPAEVRERLEAYFAPKGQEVICAYLFGSHARGEARKGSDVDVAVLFRETPAPSLMGPQFTMQVELEDVLRAPVDLVVLNTAPLDLAHRVRRDGVLVCEHDRATRARIEARSMTDYLDLLPVLKRYRRLSGKAS